MRRQATPQLDAIFGREDSAVLLATARFTDARTAVEHMVQFVESQGAGSWAFLTDARTNQLAASIYWNSTTGEVYCGGGLISRSSANVTLPELKAMLAAPTGPLSRPRTLE